MASKTHAIVVADGDVDAVWLRALMASSGPSPRMVAADGGAAKALAAGYVPDIVVGDLDSLDSDVRIELERGGVEFLVADADKDESDTELCVLTALRGGAGRISILGALGGDRPEHSVANLLLLADPRLDGIEIEILAAGSRVTRVGTSAGPGEAQITGELGDFVSLFPLGAGVEGITTEGLRFALRDESLSLGRTRGLSNELVAEPARVTTRRGCLLVVVTAPPTPTTTREATA